MPLFFNGGIMDILELIVNQYGLSIGFIIGFLFILGKTLKYCSIRLFGESGGIFTRVAEKHIEVMAKIAEIQNDQHLDIIDVKKNLAELILIYKDRYSNLSNQKLHESGMVVCDILEDLSNGIESESKERTKENLRKIRMILSKDGD